MRPPATPLALAVILTCALVACGGKSPSPVPGPVPAPGAVAGAAAGADARRRGGEAERRRGPPVPPSPPTAVAAADERFPFLALSLPDATWGVHVGFADGVKVVEDRLRAAGPWRRVVCGNTGSRLRAVVTLAPLTSLGSDAPPPTAANARDAGLERIKSHSREQLDDVRAFAVGPVAACEYVIHQARGIPVEEKTVHAWLVHGTHEIEVEVAILRFAPADQARLDAILAAFLIVEPFTPSARDHWRFAGCAADAGDAARAEAAYARALALERATPSPGDWWRDLVWEAAEWRLRQDDAAGAEAALADGLARDPGWALFHFGRARLAAARGDREAILAHLRTAAGLRPRLPEGERLPDPREDPWIGPWMAEEPFREIVEALGY